MLQLTAIVSASTLAASGNGRVNVTLSFSAAETDPYLTTGRVDIDWGDGGSDSAGPTSFPISAPLVHGYSPGKYTIRIIARNYRQPQAQVVQVNRTIEVTSSTPTQSDAGAVLFGPVLPQPSGTPSPADWEFNMGRDGVSLSSSLLMLFFTRRGERIHDPDYGTNLYELIFDLADGDLLAAIRAEIVRATSQHEPRVQFVGANVAFEDELHKSVQLQAEFVSRLSNQPLVLNLGFVA